MRPTLRQLFESDAASDPQRASFYGRMEAREKELSEKYGEMSDYVMPSGGGPIVYDWFEKPGKSLHTAVFRLRTGKKTFESIALARALDELGIAREKLTANPVLPWHERLRRILDKAWWYRVDGPERFKEKEDREARGLTGAAFDRWASGISADVDELDRILAAYGRHLKEQELNFYDASSDDVYKPGKHHGLPYSPKYDVSDPLGAYAFSPQRVRGSKKTNMRTPPPEENTELENQLLSALEGHMLGKTPIDKGTADVILDLVNRGLYQDVFGSCADCGSVFRGIGVTEKFVIDVLGMTPDDLVRMKSEGNETIDGNWVVSTVGDAYSSSWTTKFEKASDFSLRIPRGGKYNFGLILEARVGDNEGKFIDISDLGLKVALRNKSAKVGMLASEEEVIGLGDIKFNRVYIVRAKLK